MGPLQVLFFLLLKSSVARSNNRCPNSSCGNNTFKIQYPFKLDSQQTQDSCDYTDLKCNNTQNIVILNLPFSGDLYISHIDYDSSTVEIYDPNMCLPKRLMSLNLQDSPFVATYCQNTTFYDCPPEGAVRSNLTIIQCLSNLTNSVVATSSISNQIMEQSYGCSVISTSLLPFPWINWNVFDWNNNSNSLVLTWYVPACQDCSKGKGGWKAISKFIAIVLMLPAAAMLLVILLFLIACCIRTAEDFRRESPNVAAHQSSIAQITTLSSIFITAPSDEVGLDESRIKSCSELVVQDVNEDKCITKELGEINSCPICLEQYGVDKVRRINSCQHSFHADCIDQWLQTNSTCPICRLSLLDVKL